MSCHAKRVLVIFPLIELLIISGVVLYAYTRTQPRLLRPGYPPIVAKKAMRKAMNPEFSVSLRQTIVPTPNAGEKGKGVITTDPTLEGMLGGRSVLPVVEDDVPAITSTKQNAGATEVAGRALLRRENVQEAGSKVASAISIDRTGSEQTQLLRESKSVGKQKNSAAISERESTDTDTDKKVRKLLEHLDKVRAQLEAGMLISNLFGSSGFGPILDFCMSHKTQHGWDEHAQTVWIPCQEIMKSIPLSEDYCYY